MTRSLAFFAVCALFGAGCATTHEVNNADAPEWVPRAQKHLMRNEATVLFRNGTVIEGTVSRITPDSLWLEPVAPAVRWAGPLSEINTIAQPRQGLAVVAGMLGGGLVGGLIGANIGFAAGNSDVPVLGSISNGISGGAAGFLIGIPLGGLLMGELTKAHDYVLIHPRAAQPEK